MPDLVQLEKKFLAHNLQSTNLPGILLLGEEDLSITTLSNLCEDLEISMTKTDPSFSEISALSANILLPDRIVSLFICRRRFRKLGSKMAESSMSLSYVAEKVKVVIEEVYQTISRLCLKGCEYLHN